MHVLGHSRSFVKQYGFGLSPLCAPDKLSVLFEPTWFYYLRGTLSGELKEFTGNARRFGFNEYNWISRWKWIGWYKAKVKHEFKKTQTPIIEI